MPPDPAELSYAPLLRAMRGNLKTRVEFLRARRRVPTESQAIDTFLLTEIDRQRQAVEEVRAQHEKIHRQHQKLTATIETLRAPPWHEAIVVGVDRDGDGARAQVVYGGNRRLVAIDPAVELDTLAPGDPVFLGADLNVVLGKSPHAVTSLGETATVERLLPARRLVIRDRDDEIVIQMAKTLSTGHVQPGDQVVWHRDVLMAFEAVPAPDTAPSFVRIEMLDDPPPPLGGLDRELQRVVALFTEGIRHPDLASRYHIGDHHRSLIMCGPPGCGKTSIARWIAYEASRRGGRACRFAIVNGAELESPWVGETQRNVRDLFRALNQGGGPTILYIDEVESIARHRGSVVGHHSDKFLSQWLTCLDGFTRGAGVAVIGSTNRKDLIDPALLERISGIELEIGRPSRDAAREIFAVHLPASLPYQPNGTSAPKTRDTLIELAVNRLYDPNGGGELAEARFRDGTTRTITARDLASGRLFEQICLAARQRAFERHARDGEGGLAPDDMEDAVSDAIEKLARSLSARNLQHHLVDLPQDLDVVAVDSRRHPVRHHRYLVEG